MENINWLNTILLCINIPIILLCVTMLILFHKVPKLNQNPGKLLRLLFIFQLVEIY